MMYAYFCLNRYNWEPSKYTNLPLKEKLVVQAIIDDVIRKEPKPRGK